MIKIYINAAHTSKSPGGCFMGRREYDDTFIFGQSLLYELKKKLPAAEVTFFEGNLCVAEIPSDAFLIVLHRATYSDYEKNNGASVLVPATASCEVQYEAYRMLESITGEDCFRYLGVHTATEKSPFRQFCEASPLHRFLVTLGYIDNRRDNKIFDRKLYSLIEAFAEAVNEICKEVKNEDNTKI